MMALSDFNSNFLLVLRWSHIMAGITWIGLLYFFNFVNVPFQGVLEKELKPRVNPILLSRALWWFRWAAMVTLVVGLILFVVKYGVVGESTGLLRDDDGKLSGRAAWIMFGMFLGIIMWFNVWFVIWPAQKQILTWMKAGQTPPEMAGLAKRALLFSRTNTYLSGPMLFGMIAPNNYGAFSVCSVVTVSVFSTVIMWGLIKMSHKVGQTV
ncbi:MAG: urate hydroxylase PuuD [Deltaproteobacteria bacterium]|nr:urate hydroxylase PuuD [Deltaproteobacteria bacterium]